MLSEVSRAQKTKATRFLSDMEGRSKEKHIHKNEHDRMQIYTKSMLVIVELLWNSGKEGKEKKMIERQQDCKTTSVKVEDTRMSIESY
jgi:hypothetical protein